MWQLPLFLLVVVLRGVKMSQRKDHFISPPETPTIRTTNQVSLNCPEISQSGVTSLSSSMAAAEGETTVRCVLSVCDLITSERPAGTSSCQLRLLKVMLD